MPWTDSPAPASPGEAVSQLFASVRAHAATLLGLLALMWALESIDFLLPFWQADRLGIQPRSLSGLTGIAAAPLLHAGFGHLAANSLPFLVLGGIVMLGGARVFWEVTLIAALAGGAAVWILGPSGTVHLGASGLIFGYLGFLLSRGVFERSGAWIALGLVLLFAYGGMILGVLPGRAGVSWQSHLFGFLAGVAAARLLFPREIRG